VDIGAGSVNGTSATPGPGQRSASAGVSIASGKLVLPGTDGQTFYLSKVAGTSDIVRASGQVARWKIATPFTTGTGYFGLYESGGAKERVYYLIVSGDFCIYIYEGLAGDFLGRFNMVNHRNCHPIVSMLLESDNTRYFVSDDFGTSLEWVGIDAPSAGNYKLGSSSLSIDGALDEFKVWNSKLKTLSQSAFFDITNPVTGTEYEATNGQDLQRGSAHYIINFTAPTPLSGALSIKFRCFAADYYFSYNVNSSGDVNLHEQLGAGAIDSTSLAKISAGENVTLHVRMEEYDNRTWTRVGNTVRCTNNIALYQGYMWDLITEPTVKVETATDFVVTRWRAYPLASTDYGELNTARSAKSFMTIGDSKTGGNPWQVDLVADLNTLAIDQWREFPGTISAGGWTISDIYAIIDACIANRYGYPDHILINLGSNGGAIDEATFKLHYRYVIEALHAAYPNARIYLAKPVVLNGNPPSTPTAYNATLRGWVGDLWTEYPYVYHGIDETALEGGNGYLTNISDTTHYTAAGKVAIRGLWKTALGY
jgi:lysophospholipase L1-like esterase